MGEIIEKGMAIKFTNHLSELIRHGFKVWYMYRDAEVQIARVSFSETHDFIILHPTEEFIKKGYGIAGLSHYGDHSVRVEFPDLTRG